MQVALLILFQLRPSPSSVSLLPSTQKDFLYGTSPLQKI